MLLCSAAASLACTSLIATPGATEKGSPMITYAADSHVLYGALYQQPAADHEPGAMRPVIDWDTHRHLGEIPEVSHTYATVGNMNEHGLTIAESTWGGRPELEGSGTVDYGSRGCRCDDGARTRLRIRLRRRVLQYCRPR